MSSKCPTVMYLKGYRIIVINNGVDTNIFKYTGSNIKERYGIKNKKVILVPNSHVVSIFSLSLDALLNI